MDNSSWFRSKYQTAQTIIIFIFLLLFLYSNMLTRLVGVNLNAVYFGLWSIIFIWSAMSGAGRIYKPVLFIVAILLMFIVLKTRNISSVMYAGKDFFVPVLSLLIGWMLMQQKLYVESLNLLYMPFVIYGIVQVLLLQSNQLCTVIPWDCVNIDDQRGFGVTNLYQDDLLRIFGTMNSFWEYQLLVVLGGIFLLESRYQIKFKKILVANVILGAALVVLMCERTPPLILALYVFICWMFCIKSYREIAIWSFGVVSILLLTLLTSHLLSDSASAGERLVNIVTANIHKDTSSMGRVEIWRAGLEFLSRNWFFGYDVSSILPSTEFVTFNGAHFSPHNGYIFVLLLFGVVVGGVVLLLYIYMAIHSYVMHKNKVAFVMICIFLVLSIFHVPFIGRIGVFLFMTIGAMDQIGECRIHGNQKEAGSTNACRESGINE